jgi:hypothetical protein
MPSTHLRFALNSCFTEAYLFYIIPEFYVVKLLALSYILGLIFS